MNTRIQINRQQRITLTSLGRTLVVPLASIREWAEQHIEQVQAARDAFAREQGSAHRKDARERAKLSENAHRGGVSVIVTHCHCANSSQYA